MYQAGAYIPVPGDRVHHSLLWDQPRRVGLSSDPPLSGSSRVNMRIIGAYVQS